MGPSFFTKSRRDLSEIQVEARIVESDVAGLNPWRQGENFTVDAYPEPDD